MQLQLHYILEEIPIRETQPKRNISLFNILLFIINYNSINNTLRFEIIYYFTQMNSVVKKLKYYHYIIQHQSVNVFIQINSLL